MKKIMLIPDSFKGTLSSSEVIELISEELKDSFVLEKIPVADGGEGTVEAMLRACGGEERSFSVCGPHYELRQVTAGILDDETAVIEMASCAGLPLLAGKTDVMNSTTYGVGEQIKRLSEIGIRKIYVGLGGSCSNDGGCGMAAAIGVRFFDEKGNSFIPTGATLERIERIDASDVFTDDLEIIGICDVTNPLYGENGAAYIYGPQKGATPEDVRYLDKGLRHLAQIVKHQLGKDVAETPGTGAAGGLGYGLQVFANGKLKRGIDTVLSLADFRKRAAECDLIITGEGKLDEQSFSGKVIDGILKNSPSTKVAAVVGCCRIDEKIWREHGLTAVYSTLENNRKMPADKKEAEKNLTATVMEHLSDIKELCGGKEMLRRNECERADELLKYLVDHDWLCGYNLAVVTPDEEYVSTYGYRQKVGALLEARRDTIYDIASLSKVVSTTTCLLKMMESGDISLDSTIHSLLPQFRNEEITIRECMTHSSGLRDIDDYKKLSYDEFIKATYEAQPVENGRGVIFYADINFIILGFVIARLKGSLDGFATETVFKPLGMEHTCYNPENASNCAATEVTDARGVICGKVHDGKGFKLGGVGGSAGVFSCVDDLIKFVRMMMDDENEYLSPSTRQMLRTCYCDKGADRRTLGWIISTEKASMGLNYSQHALFHTGFTGGSILIDLDRKISVIVLCNRIHPNRNNVSILRFRDAVNTLASGAVE